MNSILNTMDWADNLLHKATRPSPIGFPIHPADLMDKVPAHQIQSITAAYRQDQLVYSKTGRNNKLDVYRISHDQHIVEIHGDINNPFSTIVLVHYISTVDMRYKSLLLYWAKQVSSTDLW